MKKVLYIYGNLPSYREDFFTLLSSSLDKEGIEMKVLYGCIKNKQTRQADARLYKTQKLTTKIYNLKLLRFSRMNGLLKAIKKERPDAIVFQFNQTNLSEWDVLRYCKKKSIPYGIWGCNYTRNDLIKPLVIIRNIIYHLLYRNASILIPYGSMYKDFLINMGIEQDKIIVAQNTIDIETISLHAPIKTKESYNHSTTRILYVGALAPQKCIESSIDAVAQLIDEGLDIVYDIVGGGTLFDSLKNLCSQKSGKSKERIVLHGAKYGEDLKKFFCNADLFLMPGTGGLGVNEAMAYGLPIISTIGDETIFDLIDGNGFLMSNMGNKVEQIDCIRNFISLSAEEKLEMSKQSIKLIRERASLMNMVEKHLLACKKLVYEDSIV